MSDICATAKNGWRSSEPTIGRTAREYCSGIATDWSASGGGCSAVSIDFSAAQGYHTSPTRLKKMRDLWNYTYHHHDRHEAQRRGVSCQGTCRRTKARSGRSTCRSASRNAVRRVGKTSTSIDHTAIPMPDDRKSKSSPSPTTENSAASAAYRQPPIGWEATARMWAAAVD